MQCGESIWCVLLQWLAEHGAAKELVEGLEPFVRGDEQAVAHVYERIKSIITVGVTLISGSFAIWKWWHFREAVLHKRLAEYIGESDRRLTPSRNEVVELISRPDRRTNLRQPAFALELGHVLRRNNWEPRISRVLGDNIPDREFEKITEQIDKRIRTADAALSALKEQRAAANIIAGALASARSSRTRDPATARRYSEEAFYINSITPKAISPILSQSRAKHSSSCGWGSMSKVIVNFCAYSMPQKFYRLRGTRL